MELTEEKENFVKLSHIVLDVIPIYLRIMFKDKWNEKYPSSKWTSDAKSGNTLCNKVSDRFYDSKSNQEYIPRMRSGNEEEWDTTTLLRVILYSGMNLIEGCRPKEERSSPLRVSEGLEVIREIRNSAIAHTRGMSCSSEEFERTMADLKSVVGSLFGKDAEIKINEIAKSPIDMEIWGKKESLARKLLNEIKGDIGNLQLGYEKLEKGLAAIEKELKDQNEQRKLEPITEEAICKLKSMYKERYEKHQIHIVDSKGRIELREIKLDEFTVQLKICQDESPKRSFRDEMRRFLDKVQKFEDSGCEISMLLDKDLRVTFVRGIAGIGKSVLAKQVAYGWANGIMYQEFTLCIMLECRELNYFQASKGDAVKKHAVLEEFLKENLNLDLGIGEGILFVLDGLDELYDIQNEDSVIGQFFNLNSSKYSRSKVIITGRPHVEYKLKKLGKEMGGLHRLEILGLNETEFSNYTIKMARLQGSLAALITPLPTGDPRTLLHVPQFLNTYCCVCVLTDGKIVQDSAELYCWKIYLLLKQHDAVRHGSVKTTVAEIFKEYSKSLLTISEVCNNLLNENKIIFEGDIKDLIPESEAGSSLIKSLFADVTDNFTKRYQFKHLSLMEFLAALYICSNINSYIEAIQDNVSKGNTEVVMFACVLISGFTADGIIHECLKNTTGITEINQNRFLKKVIRAFTTSKLDDEVKFLRCMEILQHFVKNSAVDANSLLVSIGKIKYDRVFGSLDKMQMSDYIITLCNHLLTVCKREADIRKAFSNISFSVLLVRELQDVKCIKYLKTMAGVRVIGITTDVTEIALTLTGSAVGVCTAVSFYCCTLEDDEELDIERLASIAEIGMLDICKCSMDIVGFDNICEVGMLCGSFRIDDLEVEEEWWVTLTDKIKERTTHGTCKLRELWIENCSTNIPEHFLKKILMCGVSMKINGKQLNPLLDGDFTVPAAKGKPRIVPRVEDDDLSSDNDSDLQDVGIADVKESADSKHSLELPIEEANYIKMNKILSIVVQNYLGKYFTELWNKSYQKWQNDRASGEFLVQKMSDSFRRNDQNEELLERLRSGNEHEWDIATLAFLLLSSDLNLIKDKRRSTVSDVRKEIEVLKDIAQSFCANTSNMAYASDEYADKVAKIKRVARNIFYKEAVQDIDDIDNSPMERKMKIKLRQLQDKEKGRKKGIDQSAEKWKDYQNVPIEFSIEGSNFMVIKSLFSNFVPKYLRQIFKKQWDKEYPSQKWQSSKSNGQYLVHKISPSAMNKITKRIMNSLETGDEKNWNSETLEIVLLCPDLKLLKPCRHDSQRKEPLRQSERLDFLMRIEKEFFSAHQTSMSCSSDEFSNAVETIKEVARTLFGKEAETEVCKVVEGQLKRNAGKAQSTSGVKKLVEDNASVAHGQEKAADGKPEPEVINKTSPAEHEKPTYGKPETKVIDHKSPADQRMPTDGQSAGAQVAHLGLSFNQEKVKEGQTDIAKLSAEKENFFKITTIAVDIIPKYLRFCFKEHWNKKYPAHKWQSDEKSGEFLVKEIPNDIKKKSGITQVNIENLRKGNEEAWDTTTLVFSLLFSGLELIPKCRAQKQRSPPLSISEEIDLLREIRNSAFAHAKNTSIKSDDFIELIASIKSIVEKVFNENAAKEIDRIKNSKLETAVIDELRQQVGMEINRNKELKQMVEEYNIKEVSDELKELYKEHCQKHEINRIEGNGKIVLKEVNIEDFAVKLTISDNLTPENTLQDEIRQLFERLIGSKGDNIDLEDIIVSDSRVTFVRGVAGMGKTVLAKKLALQWSLHKIYRDYDLCIMFECRDLNYFHSKYGNSIEKPKLLDKFIEEQCKYDLKDVKGVLFLIDGLDELYDINTDDSIIWELLDNKQCKYRKSKIIITGRPNVESKLSTHERNLGGIRKVEIQGLSDEEVMKYVRKITSDDDKSLQIGEAIDTAKQFLPIVYVPQFLNTFCCAVTLLKKGETIHSTAELYCWTIYLLMKQHVEMEDSCNISSSKLFENFSEELKSLAKVCHNLLEKNQIIFEGDIKKEVIGSRKGKEFIESLFVNVDTEKYHFRHLSLMEFLSAFHICISDQCIQILKEILERGHIDIVVYTCELIAAFPCKTIARELLENAGKQKANSVSLAAILELIDNCKNFDKKTKFQRSLDILMCYTTSRNTEKRSILQCLKKLQCESQFKLAVAESYKIYQITSHLKELCSSNEGEIQDALRDIHIGEFMVNDMEAVQCLQYLGIVDILDFKCIQNMHANAARLELSTWNKTDDTKCTLVWIEDCQFDKEEKVEENEEIFSNSNLDELVIWKSTMSRNNFINLSRWGTSCKRVIFDQLHIDNEIFAELVKAIKRKEDFKLKELVINRCTPLKEEVAKIVLQYGVKIVFNGNEVVPPLKQSLQSASSSTNKNANQSKIPVLPMHLDQSAKIKPSLPPKPATLKPSLPSKNPLAQGSFSESASLKPSPSPKKPLLRGNIPEFPVMKPPPPPKNAASYNAEVDKKKKADTNLKNEQFHVYPVEESEEQRSPPETKFESDKVVDNGHPEPSTSGNFVADHTETIKMVIDENSRSVRSHTLNVSLKFQRNSIGREVDLEVRTTTAANVPPIPCTIGETILSDVIKIEPIGIKFAKAALLSMKHSVFDMPEFSSIVIKCYDSESEEWVSLSCNTDGMKQKKMVTATEISKTSIFVLCTSLNSFSSVVPTFGSSISPFGSQHCISLSIEESQFSDDNASLTLKTNEISENAVAELSQFGLKILSILHVKVKNQKQLSKPITARFFMNRELQCDEQIIVIYQDGDGDGIKDGTKRTSYRVGKQCITAQLDHVSLFGVIIQRKCKKLDFQKVVPLLRRYTGPCFLVTFCIYSSSLKSSKQMLCIGCCEEHNREKLDKHMKKLECIPISSSQGKLYTSTKMILKIVGRYQIIDGPKELMFVNNKCSFTDKINLSLQDASLDCSKLVIAKDGSDDPFKAITFNMPDMEEVVGSSAAKGNLGSAT